MQTAVEWLLQELEKVNYHPTEAMIMYAMKLEKNQILDAYMARMDITDKEYFKQIIGGQYYNETFKKD